MGKPCNRFAIAGATVCIMHGGGAPQVKARPRLTAMVDPALGVLEYAKKRKDKDLRRALQAAKEVFGRAKPEGEGDGLEARSGLVVEYVRQKDYKGVDC